MSGTSLISSRCPDELALLAMTAMRQHRSMPTSPMRGQHYPVCSALMGHTSGIPARAPAKESKDTMLSLPLVLALSFTLVLVCGAITWLTRPLGSRSLTVALVVGIVANLIGVVLTLPLYPWIDLAVLVVAWTGGLLLGRGIAPRFQPFLLLFLCLSVGDVLVTAGASPLAPHPAVGSSAPLRIGDFLLMLPWGRFDIGLLDLLLLTGLAEHWRRRGGSYMIAVLPGVFGILLADGFLLVTRLSILPGIPFITAGYVLSEGVYRYTNSHRAPPEASSAH